MALSQKPASAATRALADRSRATDMLQRSTHTALRCRAVLRRQPAYKPYRAKTHVGLLPGRGHSRSGWVLTKALCDCGKPVRHGALRLTACPLEKALHVCTQAPLDCFVATDLRQRCALGAQRSAQPSRYRRARKHHVSKHAGSNSISICFETRGGDRVLMGDAGPV